MLGLKALVISALLLFVSRPALFGHLSYNIVVDRHGTVFFIDVFNNSVMKTTRDGVVSELVDLRKLGTWDRPHGLASDKDGNLYVAGTYEERVWKVTPKGEVTLFWPPVGRKPLGSDVLNIGFDGEGAMYALMWDNDSTKKDRGQEKFYLVKFPVGGGDPTRLFETVEGDKGFVHFDVGSMLVTPAGTVYLSGSHRIWKVDRDNKKLALVAGSAQKGLSDGQGQEARFNTPYGMSLDKSDNILVAECSGRIRRVTPEGAVTTVAGGVERAHVDGAAAKARFHVVFGVAVGPQGGLFVVEWEAKREYRLRVLTKGRVETMARIPSKGIFRP